MSRIVKVKNDTLSDGIWRGTLIASGTYYQLQELEFLKWKADNHVFGSVTSGTLVVNDGVSDLTDPVEGWDWLVGPNVEAITISGGAVTSTGTVDLTGADGAELSAVGNTITVHGDPIPLSEKFDSITHQQIFSRPGQVNNVWLRSGESTMTSDAVPQIVPWDSQLIGCNYVNSLADTEADLELHRSPVGSGASDEIVSTWIIRGARTAHDTLIVNSGIVFDAGDKLGMFAKTFDPGTRPQNILVSLLFRGLSTATLSSGSENYSGDF